MKQSSLFSFLPAPSRLALALAAATLSSAALAAPGFPAPDVDFQGRVATSPSVVYPGTTVTLNGSGFKPGQQVQFLYEGQSLAGAPVAADAEGRFSVESALPKSAAPGRHPVLVSVSSPPAALIHTLKISPELALSGESRFDVSSLKTVTGVYQSGYSRKHDALYVTAAIGRPPVKESVLARLNARSLEVERQVSPAAAPPRQGSDGKPQDAGVYAVYGVGVDDDHDRVWVSNTRQNTVAVYRQSDLGLVKQFEPGTVPHPRDVMVDARAGKVFVNAARGATVEVFDSKTLERVETLELKAASRPGGGFRAAAQPFATMSMSLDAESGKLFVVGAQGDVAVIDTASLAVERVFAVKGLVGAIGIAYDAGTRRLFLVGQGSDNVVIASADDGAVLRDVPVGAGTLGVAFDPVSKLAYALNRGSGTITVLNAQGEIVANLKGGPAPNHVTVAPGGVVYALNKGPADSPDSNHIRRIHAR